MISNLTILLIIVCVLALIAVGVLSYFVVTLQNKSSQLQTVVNTVTVTPSSPTVASNYAHVDALRSFFSSTSPLSVLCVGDQQFELGASVNNSNTYSMSNFLADIIYNSGNGTLSTDAWFGYEATAGVEARLIMSSGWSAYQSLSTNNGIGGHAMVTTTNGAYLLYTTTTFNVSRCRIYVGSTSANFYVYFNQNASGTLVNVASLPLASGLSNVKVYSYTVTSGYPHISSVRINSSTTSQIILYGMTCDDQNNNLMINANYTSSSSNWVQTAGNFSFLSPSLTALGINLVIINLGMIDISNGYDISTYVGNIIQMAQYVASQGIQCLVVIPGWVNVNNEAAYHTALKTALDSNNIAYYNNSTDFVSYTQQVALKLSPANNNNPPASFTSMGELRAAQGVFGALKA